MPAAFAGTIGLKPTRGIISTVGVVPACRSLDCVSIFAPDLDCAERVLDAAVGTDESDPFSRVRATSPRTLGKSFSFGVPRTDQRLFFGDDEARRNFEAAVDALVEEGGESVELDFTPFFETSKLATTLRRGANGSGWRIRRDSSRRRPRGNSYDCARQSSLHADAYAATTTQVHNLPTRSTRVFGERAARSSSRPRRRFTRSRKFALNHI